jgi:hypothetical protein
MCMGKVRWWYRDYSVVAMGISIDVVDIQASKSHYAVDFGASRTAGGCGEMAADGDCVRHSRCCGIRMSRGYSCSRRRIVYADMSQ